MTVLPHAARGAARPQGRIRRRRHQAIRHQLRLRRSPGCIRWPLRHRVPHPLRRRLQGDSRVRNPQHSSSPRRNRVLRHSLPRVLPRRHRRQRHCEILQPAVPDPRNRPRHDARWLRASHRPFAPQPRRSERRRRGTDPRRTHDQDPPPPPAIADLRDAGTG